jgi:hypothetical protein
MSVKFNAGQLGERRERFALSSDFVRSSVDHCRVSDFIALTKPRLMMLAVFTALVGLRIAPVRLEPLTTLAAVLAIAAGAERGGAHRLFAALLFDGGRGPSSPERSSLGGAAVRSVHAEFSPSADRNARNPVNLSTREV